MKLLIQKVPGTTRCFSTPSQLCSFFHCSGANGPFIRAAMRLYAITRRALKEVVHAGPHRGLDTNPPICRAPPYSRSRFSCRRPSSAEQQQPMLVFPYPPGTALVKAVPRRRGAGIRFLPTTRCAARGGHGVGASRKHCPIQLHGLRHTPATGSRSACCKLTPIGTLCTKRSLIIRNAL